MAQPISVPFHQNMRNWCLGNYKKEGEKSLRDLIGDAKNDMLGPSDPLVHWSVKCNYYINEMLFNFIWNNYNEPTII